jgi:hypothetical protein
MAFREGNSALYWAATRPEDITAAGAVAVGHFVQVGMWPGMSEVRSEGRPLHRDPQLYPVVRRVHQILLRA